MDSRLVFLRPLGLPTSLFNGEKFFEAHEVWEDLWHEYRDADRTFLQGLIHAAAGLYHHQCGNFRGASSQLGKALAKLEPYTPTHFSVAVDDLVRDLQNWGDPVSENVPGRPYPRLARRTVSRTT